ncbi:hypothetical protein A3A95_03135 [Candidatus Nomurabacteria bacterium RIFCSPLOWO2_01_FULL_39_18]|uniref:Pyrroloquinoline quinone-dependent pyranose dehydrogenase beta-propeller domain-containing protein n=1 Tax=Candidatus Nomurabacteria bacterium RIFCSPHIGHO2_01_FULL_40_24b TaxID=1801739 RepID=A0A1F6V7U6_9BACT|nr:MAG: hypothetical protein A2647_03425 [Candidatus Nomurabacteria bacterium RIFCSPHIGHO2_01_FULL_40_24b]OGI89667.1 MAG: hypothetical protein A3A95_03135 [Candidatus Nomurabacteria bacterium RIFCSPLOWO2_01_FULL_39_18]
MPEGFSLNIFAKNIPGARVMALDGFGNMWVSQTNEGTITTLYIKDGVVKDQHVVFKNLDKPHGLVIDNNFLYFAEETKITRVALYSDDSGQKIADLPEGGGGHFTRTLLLGGDDRLYVSIGSTCNVCHEEDERQASIYSMNKDGTDFKKVASGLRNSVFMSLNYVNGKIYATEMGRDNLGDNIPPDEINIIEAGKNYGWPNCYGKNIHDDVFDKNTYIRNPCMEPFETPSFIDLQAHSAPLGLAFIPKEGWSADYQGDLLVAYHGSWNRSIPTGYKIVRIKMNGKGEYLGTEDFITGWLKSDGTKTGRPVDIKILKDGVGYISDDYSGVIYKLSIN